MVVSRPARASTTNDVVSAPGPNNASKPSDIGAADLPIASAPPPTPVFNTNTNSDSTSKVKMPVISALGTSRTTSWVSSAASGRLSIARYHQIANGEAANTPNQPLGKPVALCPASGATLNSNFESNAPFWMQAK